MYRHLLVPVDGTDASGEAVGHAVEFARLLGARITFLHVLSDEAMRDQSGTAAVEPNALAWELLAKAEAAARAHGVTCNATCSADQTPCREILSAAREFDCDLILMAPRGRHEGDDRLGTQIANVLAVAERPVLMCAVEQRPVPVRVTSTLLGEHRAHARILHAWLRVLRVARLQGTDPDVALLRACAGFMLASSALRQDGNSVGCLDERLRGRTRVISAELDELALRRGRNKRLTRELSEWVEQYAQRLIPASKLEEAVSAYATFSWEHHGREEGVVFLAARRYLSDADWQAIDRLLGNRARPGAHAEYEQLLALIDETWADAGAHAHDAPTHSVSPPGPTREPNRRQ